MTIAVALALLAVFSLVSIVMSAEEPQGRSDPRNDLDLWFSLGRR